MLHPSSKPHDGQQYHATPYHEGTPSARGAAVEVYVWSRGPMTAPGGSGEQRGVAS